MALQYSVGVNLIVDGTPLAATRIPCTALSDAEQWITLPPLGGDPSGTYPVTEGAVHQVALVAGFMNGWEQTQDIGTTPAPFELILDGLRLQELPPPPGPTAQSGSSPQNGAFYGQSALNPRAIPSADAVTGVSSTITCPWRLVPSGKMWHVRFWLQVTSAVLGHLVVKLTHVASGTTVTVTPASGWTSGVLGSFSDDVLGDGGVANPLAAFAGLASQSDWKLTVLDPAADGTPGTFDQWGIEVT
jgi:hypothetical protein